MLQQKSHAVGDVFAQCLSGCITIATAECFDDFLVVIDVENGLQIARVTAAKLA